MSQSDTARTRKSVLKAIADKAGVSIGEISDDLALGGDGLGLGESDLMEIAMELEDRHDLEITDQDLKRWRRVGDVVKTVSKVIEQNPTWGEPPPSPNPLVSFAGELLLHGAREYLGKRAEAKRREGLPLPQRLLEDAADVVVANKKELNFLGQAVDAGCRLAQGDSTSVGETMSALGHVADEVAERGKREARAGSFLYQVADSMQRQTRESGGTGDARGAAEPDSTHQGFTWAEMLVAAILVGLVLLFLMA